MKAELPQPINPQLLMRVLVLAVILLSFLAGYYRSALQVTEQKNQQLEMMLEGENS